MCFSSVGMTQVEEFDYERISRQVSCNRFGRPDKQILSGKSQLIASRFAFAISSKTLALDVFCYSTGFGILWCRELLL